MPPLHKRTKMQQMQANVDGMLTFIAKEFIPEMRLTLVVRDSGVNREENYLVFSRDDQAEVAKCLMRSIDREKMMKTMGNG